MKLTVVVVLPNRKVVWVVR